MQSRGHYLIDSAMFLYLLLMVLLNFLMILQAFYISFLAHFESINSWVVQQSAACLIASIFLAHQHFAIVQMRQQYSFLAQ